MTCLLCLHSSADNWHLFSTWLVDYMVGWLLSADLVGWLYGCFITGCSNDDEIRVDLHLLYFHLLFKHAIKRGLVDIIGVWLRRGKKEIIIMLYIILEVCINFERLMWLSLLIWQRLYQVSFELELNYKIPWDCD